MLITHYYIVAVGAALMFFWTARNEEAVDPVNLAIPIIYVLLFPVVAL